MHTHAWTHTYIYIHKNINIYIHTCTYINVQMAWHNRFFLARSPSKNKNMREGTANKERQEGKCDSDRPGYCGIGNSSWEGRENRGPGGREGDVGTDRNID
jgi:hypothetical protein